MASKQLTSGNQHGNYKTPAADQGPADGITDVDAILQDQIARLDIRKVDQLATTITERLSGSLEGQMQEMLQLKQSVDDLMSAVTAVQKSHANKIKDDASTKPAKSTDTLLRSVLDTLDSVNDQLRDARIKQERHEDETSRMSRNYEKQIAELATQVEKLKKSHGNDMKDAERPQ